MEARGYGDPRVAPLADDYAAGPLAVQPGAHLVPQPAGLDVAGVVLDERRRHVHAEPGHAEAEPVRHDLAQRGPVGQRPRGVDGLPPRLGRVRAGVPEVERGLHGEEVGLVVPAALSRAGLEAVGGHVAPHEPVVVRVVGRRAEPRVLVRRVAGHEVEQHGDAAPAGLVGQPRQVLVGAVARRHGHEVGDVVPGVGERGDEARAEPDRVHPEPCEVVKALGDPDEVADPVAVGVREGLRVDLVQHGAPEARGEVHGGGHLSHPTAKVSMAISGRTSRSRAPRET